MADEGLDKDRENRRLSSMDSIESRWVFQDDDGENDDDSDNYNDDYEDDEDLPPQNGLDSSDDNADMRLIQTGHQVDSFDVEALEVNGAQQHDYEKERHLSLLPKPKVKSLPPDAF